MKLRYVWWKTLNILSNKTSIPFLIYLLFHTSFHSDHASSQKPLIPVRETTKHHSTSQRWYIIDSWYTNTWITKLLFSYCGNTCMVHIWTNCPLACESHTTYHWYLLVSRYLWPSVSCDSLFENIGHPCAWHGIFTEREQPPALANSGDTCCRAANISTTLTEPFLRHKFSMHHNYLLLKISFHIVFYVHLWLSYSGSCVGSLVHRIILLPLSDTNLYIYIYIYIYLFIYLFIYHFCDILYHISFLLCWLVL